MVTTIKFKDKKQARTVWVNGKAVRFKDGIATVQDDEDAKELAKHEDYDIIKNNKPSENKSDLEKLNGVGKATAIKLEKAGFTIDNINEANFDDLLEADIDNATATKILDNFKNMDDESENNQKNIEEGSSEKK